MASIGNLSATITANAQQFINEFNRADNAARRKTADIDKQLTGLEKSMKSKFGAGQITGSILTGLGIGTGFQIAEKAAEVISSYWREAAESAKKIEEYTRATADAFEKRMRARRTDDQELQLVEKSLRAIDARIAADNAIQQRAAALAGGGRGDAGQRRLLLAQALTDEQRAQLLLDRELKEGEAEELRRKIAAIAATKAEAEERERIASIVAEVAREDENRNRSIELGTELLKEQREEQEKLLAAQVRYAERFGPDMGAIKDLDPATERMIREFEEEQSAAADKAAQEWTPYQQQMFAIFDSVGDRAASTFADMMLTGENAFKSLVDVAARAMLEMAARMMIINPLLNAVFGLTGTSALPTMAMSALFGGGRASGGSVSSGTTYLVGEEGPEMFTPRTSGRIIPNHQLNGGGYTEAVTINNYVQAGVSRAELIPALNATSEATIARIRDMDRRRK
jgi:signal transduction histidine kinase